jgi:hypothetical protein
MKALFILSDEIDIFVSEMKGLRGEIKGFLGKENKEILYLRIEKVETAHTQDWEENPIQPFERHEKNTPDSSILATGGGKNWHS